MTYETIVWSVDDRVLTITLNRPDAMISFTVARANELVDAFTREGSDRSVVQSS
jgi:enoyl-CoA hydratase/carnithine racemase